jgi:hypothetical protein
MFFPQHSTIFFKEKNENIVKEHSPLYFFYIFRNIAPWNKNPLHCMIRDKLYYRIMSLKKEKKRTGRQKNQNPFSVFFSSSQTV